MPLSGLPVVRQQSGSNAGLRSKFYFAMTGVTEPCREWPTEMPIGADYVSIEASESWPITKLGRTMIVQNKSTRQFDDSIPGGCQ
jgi:hypothetical protein